jgi:hypothetical protein
MGQKFLSGNLGFDQFRQQNKRFLPAEVAHLRGCNFECRRIASRFKIPSIEPSYE